MRLSPPHIARGFLLTLLCALLLFGVPSASGQDAASSPASDISPWWAVPILGAIAVALEVIRRYINSRIDARIEAERNARALENKKFEQDSNVRMEKIRADQAVEQSDTRKIELLAGSISEMAASIRDAYQNLATDRQQAATERQGFRMELNENTSELKRHGEELARLRTAVETLAVNATDILNQIKAIQGRIGGATDDPPLTKLIGEAASAAQSAANALAQAQQQVAPIADAPALHAGDVVKLEAPPPEDASSSKLPGSEGLPRS